jgi:hypothetical protein
MRPAPRRSGGSRSVASATARCSNRRARVHRLAARPARRRGRRRRCRGGLGGVAILVNVLAGGIHVVRMRQRLATLPIGRRARAPDGNGDPCPGECVSPGQQFWERLWGSAQSVADERPHQVGSEVGRRVPRLGHTDGRPLAPGEGLVRHRIESPPERGPGIPQATDAHIDTLLVALLAVPSG